MPRLSKLFSIVIFLSIFVQPAAILANGEQSSVLTAERVRSAVTVDGIADEFVWDEAKSLNIEVKDGGIGTVIVSMRALYDADNIYFLINWPDPSRDVSKKQWIFHPETQRWVHATRLNPKGKRVTFDEDRFTIKWNIDDSVKGFNTAACAMICHGDRMHTNGPDERVDTWHWKAARTNPVGYADDKWLDQQIAKGFDDDAREAARHGDDRNRKAGIPAMEGDCFENSRTVQWGGESLEIPWYWEPGAEGEDALFITQQEIDMGEAVAIEDPLVIDLKTPIPGYVLFRPVGSRGDIEARGVWENGVWTLEMKRKLETGNDDDVQFDCTKLYRFGIAIMDNTGGFEAQGVGHSFDLGARTLEFGGTGSEDVTTMALVRDYLLTALTYSRRQKIGMAQSEIDMALALFYEVQWTLADLDPKTYLIIKSDFSSTKRNPSEENIQKLAGRIDHSILLLQGKVEPAEAPWFTKMLAWWGKIQRYVLILLGLIAIILIYKSTAMVQRKEFRVMGVFILLIMTPIVLEGIGRAGILFKVQPLRNLSFMTSELATLIWALLMIAALFIGRLGFKEIDTVLNFLRRQKESLQELSRTDELTRVHNRRYFNERLSEYLLLVKRYNISLSLLLLDIDHFKAINDTYGHACGDEALKHVANLLKGMTRKNIDFVGRYGGEEFVILLYGTTRQVAKEIAEKIRKAIQEKPFLYEGKRIHFTASVGIASFPSSGIKGEEELINKADEALYAAKRDGRNCIRSC